MSFSDNRILVGGAGLSRPLTRWQVFGAATLRRWRIDGVADPLWRLYCNRSDGMRVRMGGDWIELRAGTVCLLPAWTTWSGRCVPGVQHVWASVTLPEISAEQHRRAFPVPLVIEGRDGDEIRRLFHDVADAGADEVGAPAQVFRLRAAYDLALACYVARHPPPPPWPAELRLLGDHVERHLDRELGVDELAAVAHCSAGHLNRLFRRLLGTTPAAYVRERRVRRAAELLSESDDGIDLIAARCGFGDRHVFTKVFARIVGRPPAAYRRNQRL